MKRFYRYMIAVVATIIMSSALVPPLAYASEVNYQAKQVQKLTDINNKLNSPQTVSETLINELAAKYKDVSKERIREIANLVSSPYSTRANILDGRGVTLGEFAVAFDIVLGWIVSGGVSKIGQIAAQNGAAYARSILSRAAAAAASRVGVLTGWLSKILDVILPFVSFYSNIGYNIARMIDARDFYPNNGRINAWK